MPEATWCCASVFLQQFDALHHLLPRWFSRTSTAFSTMRVSTTNTASNSNSGVDVQIMGGVTINFRTDYLPLDQG